MIVADVFIGVFYRKCRVFRDIVTVLKCVIPHTNFEKREDSGFEQVAVGDRGSRGMIPSGMVAVYSCFPTTLPARI